MKPVPNPESAVRSSTPQDSTGVDAPVSLAGRPTSDFKRRTLLVLIIVCGLAGLYHVQKVIDGQYGSDRGQHEELMLFPAQSKLPRLAGGYSGLMAAIYWTRAVQYYGRHRLAHDTDFALLGTLLD